MLSWPALLVAPLVALSQLSIAYSLVSPACAHQDRSVLHAVCRHHIGSHQHMPRAVEAREGSSKVVGIAVDQSDPRPEVKKVLRGRPTQRARSARDRDP